MEKTKLKDLLKEKDDRTTREIKKPTKEKFRHDFTQKHVQTILRSLGVNLVKYTFMTTGSPQCRRTVKKNK